MFSVEASKLGFSEVIGEFFESRHWKGISDGVGGSNKWKADSRGKYGMDIASACDFCEAIRGSSTIVYFRESQKLQRKAIKGTMKINGVFAKSTDIPYTEQLLP